jgi:hypothetical protein
MKLYLSAVFLVLSCTAALATQVQPASGNVNVTASITPQCRVTLLANPTITLKFSNTPAQPSATINTSNQTATFSGSSCNIPTHIAIHTINGGATGGDNVADPAHQAYFDYLAIAKFDTASVTLDTSAYPKGDTTPTLTSPAATSGPFSGSLTVDVKPYQPAHPLVVGTYQDSIRVTLTAN